ncbi:FtsJ-like methyltransferase-domain-containing protein, partial [Syncephalastrum racemosum]
MLAVSRRVYSSSSKGWIQRQARDPYAMAARTSGGQHRARSAFKLKQLDEKYRLMRRGSVVVDCGAAPGGWSQVAAQKVKSAGLVVAVDLLPIEPIPNVHIFQGDFREPDMQTQIQQALQGRKVDLVCSDMAPNFSGNPLADHARSMELCESVLTFADKVLAHKGNFVAKVLLGGDEVEFRRKLQTKFAKVKQQKPDASRKESREAFIVALGYGIGKNKNKSDSNSNSNSNKVEIPKE